MFKVTPHESRTLRWWYEQYLSKRINMEPTYQRRSEVWSKWKKSHLIDSIINDFDIPKFYVANFQAGISRSLNEGHSSYAIIDGKQRLGAIFGFFNDEVALNPSCVLDDNPEIKLGRLTYSALKAKYPSIATRVDDYVPTVMTVDTDSEHKIEELFVRLNMGEATTGAERRNAMGGPVPIMARELAQHPFFQRKIKFSIRRMQEHNLIVKLLLLEFRGGFVDTKAKNLDDFTTNAVTWMHQQESAGTDPLVGPYSEARDRVVDTLERLTSEFDDQDKLLSKQGEIPIYYWIAREHPKWVNELRDFTLEFATQVLETVRLQRDDPESGDKELSLYYTLSRTTNDQLSLEGRYRIFAKRFGEFRRRRGRHA